MGNVSKTARGPDERATVTPWKTEPRAYQQAIVEKTAEMPYLALFLEQGLGKSKVGLDCAAHLYQTGKIDGLVVLSKTQVVENWFLEEIPKHLGVPYVAHLYSTRRKGKIPPPRIMPQGCLNVLLINDGCMRTQHGADFVKAFSARFSCLLLVDESTIIKNPAATITKRAIKFADQFPYRRVLCGEPAPNGPADYYSQYKFLSPSILGVGTFTAYKAMFCEQEPVWINARCIQKPTGRFTMMGQSTFEALVAPYTIRLKKADVLPDLPEKQYVRRKFFLQADVLRAYNKLADEFLTELVTKEHLGTITAPLAISRITRLHQLASGHAVTDEGATVELDSGRYDVLRDILDERPEGAKTIIWAHYRQTIDFLTDSLNRDYGSGSAVRLYGSLGEVERSAVLTGFKSGPARFLIANPATAGWGLTLTEADAAVYYSNSYNYEHRAQSEDRIHRIGQTSSKVTYFDIVAEGTVDERILDVLKRKEDFSRSVLTQCAQWFSKATG